VKNNAGWIWLGLIFLVGCGTADLRPSLIVEHGISEAKLAKARQIAEETIAVHDPEGQWKKFSRWEVVGADHWESAVLRLLTPVREDTQRFQLIIHLGKNEAVYTFLDGLHAGDMIGCDGGEFYRVTSGQRYDVGVWKSRLYFDPLRQSFLWTQNLLRMPVLVYGGRDELNDQFYYKIYAAETSDFDDPKMNQYILWINQVTRRIDLVEYTLRDVLKSYQGTVHYSAYENIGGVLVPSLLRFGAKPFGGRIHEVRVESQSLR
jgi:hypothetical protein